jgi:hypothetical protein
MLGVAYFKNRSPSWAIATEYDFFFCGNNDKTFTNNIEEAHFFETREEAVEALGALKELLKKEHVMPVQEVAEEKIVEPNEKKNKADNKARDILAIQDIVNNICAKPKDFWKISVIHLYDNRYRVNVWVKGEKIKIEKSYFIKFRDNLITFSEPALQ